MASDSGHPDPLRVALAQLTPVDGDKARNLAAAGAAVAAAARAGARVVVLPEYMLTGFPAERMATLAESLDGPSVASFRGMAADAGVLLVAGLPRRADAATNVAARIYDTTVVIAPGGELLSVYDKTHLFDREKTVFTPGAAFAPPFAFGEVRFGVLCCFDIEFPEAARALALQGAQCLLVPSANMEPWGGHHRAFVRARALENHAFVAYANAVGAASGYVFEGQSCLVDPLGSLLCDAGRGETVVWGDVDLALCTDAREVGDYLDERRPDLYA
jgi:predicted amidohydrolase